jgi:hypothetical protein
MRHSIIKIDDVIRSFGAWGFVFGILEVFNVPMKFNMLYTLLIPIVLLIIIMQVRVFNKVEYRLKIRTNSEGVGDELINHIRKAKNYILVSHFRGEKPSRAYLEALHGAKGRGVRVNRLVGLVNGENIANDSNRNWILEENENNKAVHKFINIGDIGFGWEIYVFDGKVSAIALPSVDPISEGELPNVLISVNSQFVTSLKILFEHYWVVACDDYNDSGPNNG